MAIMAATLMPYMCTFCGAFRQIFDRLKRHVNRHRIKFTRIYSGKKPAVSKANHIALLDSQRMKILYQDCLTQPISLAHNDRDITEKPYHSEHCQQDFAFHSPLSTWPIRTHTTKKVYQCEHCQKCFSQRGHLTSHIKTHTKPYKCELVLSEMLWQKSSSEETHQKNSHQRENTKTVSV